MQRDYSQVRGCGLVALPDSNFLTERLRPIYYRRIGHQQGPGIVSKQYVDISPASSWTSPAGDQGPAASLASSGEAEAKGEASSCGYRHRNRSRADAGFTVGRPLWSRRIELAGALRGKAVEVVRAETVDLMVPATAEIVIEGYIRPEIREVEGPFGEVGGYSTPKFPKPVIEVTAITHRKDPIFQAALTGMPTTENHVLRQIPMEATYYWELKKRHPGVTAVHFPAAGAILFLVIIAMKQTYLYEARNAIASMFATRRNKIIIVVDDDVDIYDMEKVMWAVTP